MQNMIEFGRSVLSYGLVMLVSVLLMGVATALGITLAKRKNAKKAVQSEESDHE